MVASLPALQDQIWILTKSTVFLFHPKTTINQNRLSNFVEPIIQQTTTWQTIVTILPFKETDQEAPLQYPFHTPNDSKMSRADFVPMMDKAYFVGRHEILAFFNDLLDLNLSKIEQTATGAIACQLTEYIFPGSIQLSRINWEARSVSTKVNRIQWMKLLRKATLLTKDILVVLYLWYYLILLRHYSWQIGLRIRWQLQAPPGCIR